MRKGWKGRGGVERGYGKGSGEEWEREGKGEGLREEGKWKSRRSVLGHKNLRLYPCWYAVTF